MKSIIKFITVFIPWRDARREVRRRLTWWWYGISVRRTAGLVGAGLMANTTMHMDKATEIGIDVGIKALQKEGRGRLLIGNHVRIGHDVLVLTENHDYNDPTRLPFADGWIPKDVTIGDYVWMGHRVTILPGTTTGEGAIIQTGSVVHGEIPPLSIAGGNPARPFAARDKVIYEQAKAAMNQEAGR